MLDFILRNHTTLLLKTWEHLGKARTVDKKL